MDTEVRRPIMLIFGTRPEAIKMAPVVLELARSSVLYPVVAVTAQHRGMLDQVLDLFEIKPDYDLNIIQQRQSLAGVTIRALEGLEPLMNVVTPDMVLVQGDTTTTFMGALAAFYHQIPVGHLEAGLRTHEPYSPYPEEINRQLTTRLTTLHFAPTRTSKANLLAERVDESRVTVTGNTVIDALLWTLERGIDYGDPTLARLDDDDRRVILVTAHRRESWGPGMRSIGTALGEIARAEPDVLIVFPIHKNPAVRESIEPVVKGLANVLLVEPLAYHAFAKLMGRSHIVLTDSGGIQEEAPSLGKPVLVMRDTSERPEAIEAGTVRLIGTDAAAISGAVRTLLHDDDAYAAMANAVNPYGDGAAARRTVMAVEHFFGHGPAPDQFG
ncbi:MAG TPA: UDP-N-acetylglucosamine 2-epimerase (non-hydrolyzing) [Actinomycetota bacterium]|nr:UDP-N-acetylglucosamine 2-epimerase (non-hydrolyzing) [Actinomycetota bacterium]